MVRSWMFLWLVLSSVAHAELDCFRRNAKKPNLPKGVEVGIANVLSDPLKLITSFVPIGSKEVPGTVADIHKQKFPLPHRFIISDGTLTHAFIGVDQSKGTRLALCLDELLEKMGLGAKTPADDAYETITQKVMDYLAMVEEDEPLPWDRNLRLSPEMSEQLKKAVGRPTTEAPFAAGATQPVIALEAYLKEGRSFCIHKTLIASLLLQRLNLKHRLVFGGGQIVGVGHNWVELPDKRILDSTWQVLDKPSPAATPGWINHGISQIFANERYPYLVLKSDD